MKSILICILYTLLIDRSRGTLSLSHYAKRFADDVHRQRNYVPECTKTTVPCRCTEVYPREIVIECKKATLKQVEDSIAAVAVSKMQVLAIDIYTLILSPPNRMEFHDNFFAKHGAVPRALVVQDCKIRRGGGSKSSSLEHQHDPTSSGYPDDPMLNDGGRRRDTSLLLNFAPEAFKTLEDIMVTLKVDCPTSTKSLEAVKKLRLLNVLQLNQLAMPKLETLPFQHLIHLDLRKNDIADIEDSAFTQSVQLENVNLAHNRLQTFKISIFQKLDSLKELTVSHNKISSIEDPSTTQSQIPSLEHLDLSHNALTRLKSNFLPNQQKLKILKLESNAITEILPGQFDDLINLEILSLHDNPLKILSNNSMRNLTNLKNLYLSQACIVSQQDSRRRELLFKDETENQSKPEIGIVDIGSTVLKIESNGLAGLTQLRMLDFDCSLLADLNPEIFAPTTNLKYLILANTRFIENSNMAAALDPVVDSQQGGVSSFALTNQTFKHLHSLTHLYLAGFDLDSIQDESVFDPLTSLQELNLVNYTPVMPQCRRVAPTWLEALLKSDDVSSGGGGNRHKNYTVALPNCLPKAYQRYYRHH